MKKLKHFTPPLHVIDFDIESTPVPTPEDLEKFYSSTTYKKYVLPMLEHEKKYKHLTRMEWWKSNLIPLLGLLFAFISALPVIIDFIGYIQSKII